MANEIEILVTTRYDPGKGLAQAAQQTKADATRIAADIERIFDRSADGVSRAFSDVSSKVNRDLQKIRDNDVQVDIKVDDTQVRRAEGDIRDLDSIPPPTITPKADASQAVNQIENTLGNIDVSDVGDMMGGQLAAGLGKAGPIGAAAAAIGALFADEIGSGFTRGWTSGATLLSTQIQTGFGPERAAMIGRAAGDAYSAGFGESAEAARAAAITLERTLGDIDPSLNLREASKWALILADNFGIDVAQQAELAGRMIQQGLAKNTEDAYDMMIAASQKYGAQTDEVFDAVREFGAVFQKFGIDGAAAITLVGDTYTTGLTSQVERAAEAIEELNTRITDGDSREAIKELGLDFEDVANRIAQGGDIAEQAINDVVTAILAQENAADQGRLANAVFGASFETLAGPDAIEGMVTAIAEATTATSDFGGTATEVTGQAEAMRTEFDKAKRTVEGFAKSMGEQGAREFNKWIEAGAAVVDTGKAIVGFFGDFVGGADEATTAAGELTGVTDALAGAFPAASDGAEDAGDAAGDAADEFDELEAAVTRAKDALDKWADDTGERAVIALREAVLGLNDSFDENTVSSFSMKDGWDLSTEAGLAGAKATLAFKGEVADLSRALLDGKITSGQFSSEMHNAEAALRATLSQTSLTTGEINTLIATMLGVPDIDPEVDLRDNASEQIRAIERRLGILNGKTANTYTNHYVRTYRSVHDRPAGTRLGAAGGGGADAIGTGLDPGPGIGIPTLVNEGSGPESVRLPQGDVVSLPAGSTIFTAEDTEAAAMRSSGGGPGVEVNVTVMGSVWSGRDLAEEIRDHIYTGSFEGLGGVN